MKEFKTNITMKVAIVVTIMLLLWIPTTMVKTLVVERENYQKKTIDEVSEKWGESQTIAGPFVSIPYYRYTEQLSKKDTTQKVIKIKKWIYFLPESLVVDGNVLPERRYRGIYETVVYESQVNISGSFSSFDFAKFDIDIQNIDFENAVLNLGISDLKGIEEQIALTWNNDQFYFNSGTSSIDVVSSGINSQIEISNSNSATYTFNFNLILKGSQLLYFVPVGKVTDVNMSSKWANPSFGGEFLPDSREVSEDGFTAYWNILHLNRNYPQSWNNDRYSILNSSFGVDLLLPVDRYQKSLRIVKYAMMFIAFTFLVFFFTEVLNKVFIHPIQYILVGIAIVVFYSLLLAFAEHLKFNLSYLLSAILTLLLIGGYVQAILKSKKFTLAIFSILGLLYGFIFTIIQLQDYALLIGSIGIFIVLALVMYYSRKIDWYSIRLGEKNIE